MKWKAFLDVLQPCPTYNDINTREWYLSLENVEAETGQQLPRSCKLEETSYDYGQDDLEAKMTQVIQRSNDWADKIQLNVFYRMNIYLLIKKESLREFTTIWKSLKTSYGRSKS